MTELDSGPADVVAAHIAAFNARDADAVVATFADDAVFANADEVIVGRAALAAVFGDAFEAPWHATLELTKAVADGETMACELTETIVDASATLTVALAGFFTVRDGRLVRVRIYREGVG